MIRSTLRGVTVALLLVACLAAPAPGEEKLTVVHIGRIGKAATALVECDRGGGKAHGSAFCIHASGLFVTNRHVVAGSTAVRLVLDPALKTQRIVKAEVIRTDPETDLALLRAEGVEDLPVLALGDSGKVEELEEVVACGFPFGKSLRMAKDGYPAVSLEKVTVTSLRLEAGELHRIQVDVTLEPGNSGGALLNLRGKIVGVVVSGVRGAGGHFVIPSDRLAAFLAVPDLRLTAPALTRANQDRPASFEARVVSAIAPGHRLSVDLVLRAGNGPERRQEMKFDAGVYRLTAVPVPPVKRHLELTAQFETGTVTGLVADRDIAIGKQQMKLSACSRLQSRPHPVVTLTGGKTIEGAPTGLEKVDFLIGGQTVTLDLSRSAAVKIDAPGPVTAVDCTLIARQGVEEVGRSLTRLPIGGVALVEAADPSAGGLAPPELAGDKVVKKLPDLASDICVGGGGRYLVLHLPKLKKLAIFDVNAAAIVRYIPLTDDKIVYAAGLDKVVIGLTKKGVVERWDLRTGKKESSRTVPGAADIDRVLLGSASHGPVLVNSVFHDLRTLSPLPITTPKGHPAPWSPVSADGTVFGAWKPNQSPAESTSLVLGGDELKRYDAGGLGHIVPGPDGRAVFTAKGVWTNQLKASPDSPSEGYCLPAVEGNFYLTLTSAAKGKGGRLAVSLLGNELPLVKDAGIDHGIHFDGWDRNFFGPWKRVFLLPKANLVVVFPESNDRLELHRFDVDKALEKSGRDYLLVTTRPPLTAKRGAEFVYRVGVKSNKGGVKFEISSGPEGMTVSPKGEVEWKVPADAKAETVEVILGIRSGAAQEVFHTFALRLTDK